MKIIKRIILISNLVRERLKVTCGKGELWPYHFASVRSIANGNMFSTLDISMIRVMNAEKEKNSVEFNK